uniref:Uncharacterized protein n=1 Tax=Acrobeloides nanus TaxID=290746 RepID=A0A914CU98_9BILA
MNTPEFSPTTEEGLHLESIPIIFSNPHTPEYTPGEASSHLQLALDHNMPTVSKSTTTMNICHSRMMDLQRPGPCHSTTSFWSDISERSDSPGEQDRSKSESDVDRQRLSVYREIDMYRLQDIQSLTQASTSNGLF